MGPWEKNRRKNLKWNFEDKAMATLNKVFLIGRLGRDPEVRVTTNGNKVCGFSMAVEKEVVVKDGTKREETTWVDVEAWGKTAEYIEKYIRKGSSVHLEGRLKLEEWKDKTTGADRKRMKVVVERLQGLDPKGGQQGQQEERREERGDTTTYPGGRDESPRRGPAAAGSQDPDEEVPF